VRKNSNFAKKLKPFSRKTTIVFNLYGLNEEEPKVIIEATKA